MAKGLSDGTWGAKKRAAERYTTTLGGPTKQNFDCGYRRRREASKLASPARLSVPGDGMTFVNFSWAAI